MSVDFVAIGHVTLDRTRDETRPGGAAYYAALTAQRLGLRVGLLTSFGLDFPAPAFTEDLEVVNVPSSQTTSFTLRESASGRALALLARAADLEADALPARWRRAALAMLCPVANEVDPMFAASFPDSALGVLPQGWMRERGPGGAIAPRVWEDARPILSHAQLLVLSAEDVAPFRDAAIQWFQHVPVGALTDGRRGATLFVNGEPYRVEPDAASEVDATGAGDVFAAALLVEYQRRGDPWDAAAAAACAAAASVEAPGSAAIPVRSGLDARLAAYRRRQGG